MAKENTDGKNSSSITVCSCLHDISPLQFLFLTRQFSHQNLIPDKKPYHFHSLINLTPVNTNNYGLSSQNC